MTKPDFHFK